MKRERIAGLEVLRAGGTDGDGGGDGPAVVLMHGFGAPGEDLAGLWRALEAPRGTRWFFPAAPLSLAHLGYGDGRAWWHIDMVKLQQAMMRGEPRVLSEEVPPGLPEARAQVLAMLAELEQKHAVRGEALVLGGFSQGSMLALDVALHTEGALAGVVLWSSTLLADREWAPRMPARKGLRVLQSHGRGDPILPYALAEVLRDKLTAAGCALRFVPFRGGHEIPSVVCEETGRFLREALAPA